MSSAALVISTLWVEEPIYSYFGACTTIITQPAKSTGTGLRCTLPDNFCQLVESKNIHILIQ